MISSLELYFNRMITLIISIDNKKLAPNIFDASFLFSYVTYYLVAGTEASVVIFTVILSPTFGT